MQAFKYFNSVDYLHEVFYYNYLITNVVKLYQVL